MGDPVVTVVLPCYNPGPFLDAAVASVIGQTYAGWELILYDDGSTDGAVARVAAAQCSDDPRIRVIAAPHEGLIPALQAACRLARGRFLARMDADDVADRTRLEKQLAFMDAHAGVALCGTLVEIMPAGARLGLGLQRYERWVNSLVTHEQIARELFVECPIPHPTFFMRRDAFEAVGGYEEHGWAEDYDLCLRLWQAGNRLGKVPECLLRWRNTPGRLSLADPRYAEARFRAFKRHYLAPLMARGGRALYQWGAGEVGKRWMRDRGAPPPAAVVDINPRKVGRTIHGVTVIAPDGLPPPGTCLVLVAVGAPGARDEIRAWLDPRGYQEGADYVFVA